MDRRPRDYWRPLGEAEKSRLLRGQDHGTQVVSLGEHERHDTSQAPPSVTDARRHWITRYLAGRFLRFPAQVEVLVREHHGPDTHPRRQIRGEQHHLEQHAVAAGTVALSDAIVRWWVLDNDHRARRREAALWASTGHAAAVLDDELYDVLAPTRGGYGRLQDFGIRFGNERVVPHIEPQAEAGRVQCNTARTTLLLDHEPLPWAGGGEEFAAAMPAEILRLQERAAGTDCGPRREAIRGRVGGILPVYRLSRYRPTRTHSPRPDGPAAAQPANASTGPPAPRRPAPQHRAGRASSMRIRPGGARAQPRRQPGAGGRPRRRRAPDRDRRPAGRRVDLRARRNPGARRPRATRPPATTPPATT